MSQQNRFLLPGSSSSSSSCSNVSSSTKANNNSRLSLNKQDQDQQDQENQHSVDTDFDSYWEEEARNPHRNRIRIGRQYQATVPGLLKQGEKDRRKLDDIETLSFCPKRSAKVSNAELDHYFTVAKSLNLFASLVETRSLLGRDVTIADLNHIRRKEGLSLASVIQPVRQAAIPSPQSSQQSTTTTVSTTALLQQQQQQLQPQQSPQKSPAAGSDGQSSVSSVVASPREQVSSMNQPLMKALSHFISLHHPCHHDANCKKLQKDIPFEDNTQQTVSITAGNLRQGSSTCSFKESKPGRSRSSLKQQQQQTQTVTVKGENQQDQQQPQDPDQTQSGDSVQSPSIEDWTREEVELFSKAIEVCGKNFGSIKKDFLPSKSVKSIVEYYYIGSRDLSDNKKKSNQSLDTGDTCSSPEKSLANNNGQGGGGGGPPIAGKNGASTEGLPGAPTSSANSSSSRNSANTDPNNPNKDPADTSGVTDQASFISNNLQLIKNEQPNLKQVSGGGKSGATITNGAPNSAPKNIDARMSVYNFDDEFRDDSPVQLECPKPGAEVRPLKAKPIIPNASAETDSNNSNVGSLKFFMDGQLVLKLNACQDQQEGAEKCQWVQSGERHVSANRQKRYTKRSEKNLDANQNGSQSDSVVSSFQDDDSKIDDLSGDDDSKESMNSFTNSSAQARANNQLPSPNSKRLKVASDSNLAHSPQLPSPVDYNRLALNNRIKERNDTITRSNSAISQAMPWLQANSFAMAAALLGGLPYSAQTNMIQETQSIINSNNNNTLNSKPMDLSVEHHSPPKAIPKSTSRSRSRSKNN